MKGKLLYQGAESKIYQEDDTILKERFIKKYRLKHIDDALRKARTRKEAKVLEDLKKIGFASPSVISIDEKKMTLKIEKIDGKMLKEVIDDHPKEYGYEIGEKVAILHDKDIIHGDLTTSNMILSKKDKKIYFIDFGLSFTSKKEEDKAVDLHLLHRALESKHYKVFETAFDAIIRSYKKNAKNGASIIDRYKKVEERGRNKVKI